MIRTIRNLAVVLLVGGAAISWGVRPAAAIAHGEDAAQGEYRFAVMLTMTGLPADGGGTRDSWCSGALIAPQWVITAGHCFRDGSGQRVSRMVAERTTAIVGRSDLSSRDGHEIEVVEAHQADGADVALAKLAEPITDITPIRVGTAPPAVNDILRLTGFGLVTHGGEPAPPTRLQTGRFIVDAIGDSLIETSGRQPRSTTSPCPHDSGGPYFSEQRGGVPVLVAVVSSGPGCPHTGPDFSARTDNLGAWITETINSADAFPLVPGALSAVALALVVVFLLRLRPGSSARRRPSSARG